MSAAKLGNKQVGFSENSESKATMKPSIILKRRQQQNEEDYLS